jgi:nucleoside-diphosphate-sugar epimerase
MASASLRREASMLDRLSAGDGDDLLLTGATRFLGMELLARYLERTGRTVLALVRARDRDEARKRDVRDHAHLRRGDARLTCTRGRYHLA